MQFAKLSGVQDIESSIPLVHVALTSKQHARLQEVK